MKKIWIIFIILVIIIAAALLYYFFNFSGNGSETSNNMNPYQDNIVQNLGNPKSNLSSETDQAAGKIFDFPVNRAGERVTKKPFGIYITPQNSPLQPEKFSGYHTGADFEIFPDETEKDVEIFSICSGPIISKRTASGYGGLLVQSCELESEPITVIYGHLKISSTAKNVGDNLDAGERIGFLGDAYSTETDGERKHLHLGIHRGKSVNILGYVQNQSELSNWINPCEYVCY